MTLPELLATHCHPTRSPLDEERIAELLALCDQWERQGNAIARTFRFTNFHETMAFVNAVAWIAHHQDHHPDMIVGFNRCHLTYSTHSAGGLSLNDFICAARVNTLWM